MTRSSAGILGIFAVIAFAALGLTVGQALMDIKQLERTVTVKGLSEREVAANIVIWPIQFTVADNDLSSLYASIESQSQQIGDFLQKHGVAANDISYSAPAITDKSAQAYGNNNGVAYRYTAMQSVTVYSAGIDKVRAVMNQLSELGKAGIVFTGGGYMGQTEYLFTGLNDIKPAMVEEATRQAREVAQKFASDSNSKLGKIKRASQGQFSISARDKNNPHIKKVRVVSTVEYYLSD
ncbi:SIMPL domain-containing protein [Neptunicella marina]|uniref:SIMPL domain-containing protein n=1 Tax=Neptunicella marina TaxID=2125989 RepID=A0A8J6ISX5_9ALTE|nr:SIMPL domain-containing protein [Neptunicella marina]MBC3766840.1 SIMPL domain-containing protein [Neptunicella marina]